MYLKQTALVRIEDQLSVSENIGRRVCEGRVHVLSPVLFSIYIGKLIREAMKTTGHGVNVEGIVVKAIRIADDCQTV